VDVSFNQIGGVSTFCFLELVSKCKLEFLLHMHFFGFEKHYTLNELLLLL